MFVSKKNADIFLTNLAVVDLLACISSMAMVARNLTHPTLVHVCLSSLGHFLMKPLGVLSLTLLTINRFYAITKAIPLKAFNRRRSLWYVFGIWCFSVLITVSAVIGTGMSLKAKLTALCYVIIRTVGKVRGFIFGVNIVCFVITTVYNIKIWLFVRNHNRRIAEQNVLPKDVVNARNIKLAKLVIAISLSYVIGYMFPSIVFSLVFRAKEKLQQDFSGILSILSILNHANNFIIFAVADKRFRDEVKRMIYGCFGWKEAEDCSVQTQQAQQS